MQPGTLKPELLRQLQKAVNNARDEMKPTLQEMLDVVARNIDQLSDRDVLQLLTAFVEFEDETRPIRTFAR